jgi:hypothetical protein
MVLTTSTVCFSGRWRWPPHSGGTVVDAIKPRALWHHSPAGAPVLCASRTPVPDTARIPLGGASGALLAGCVRARARLGGAAADGALETAHGSSYCGSKDCAGCPSLRAVTALWPSVLGRATDRRGCIRVACKQSEPLRRPPPDLFQLAIRRGIEPPLLAQRASGLPLAYRILPYSRGGCACHPASVSSVDRKPVDRSRLSNQEMVHCAEGAGIEPAPDSSGLRLSKPTHCHSGNLP